MPKYGFDTYLSPFTWRYGSQEMRHIWSETYKRHLWRKIWVALAEAQQQEGLVTQAELDDLKAHADEIDIDQAHDIEKEIGHDLMAEVTVFAKQATVGGGKIHLGATSMDIEDNTDTIRYKESLVLVEQQLKNLLIAFTEKIETHKNTVCMAYTHLQPAEPTTLGYRFAFYAQDLLFDLQLLHFVQKNLKGKGLKGAVGTAASYTKLLDTKKAQELEQKVMEKIGINSVTIASQTGPRKIEVFVSYLLASIAQSLYKFAFDIRLMQSPGFGEWQEPFGKKQVGSSAMPFKRNPVKSEQICSLARLVMNLSRTSSDNAAHMLFERTLDDSANRRVYLPEMFLAVNSILTSATNILNGLVINQKQIEKNLAIHGPFASAESILMEAAKKGANRQEIHEVLRAHAMDAYETTQATGENPFVDLLKQDKTIAKFLTNEEIQTLLDPAEHTGIALEKCETARKEIDEAIKT